ncbi:hypothetical protein [Dawidia soli]|uniref:Uncharacterized protein n=1 Tax=Dawidia soli TaxID=2782352 RepID=A0AAP2D8I8_9BACT|nr:hypothetical protein [Dawidia soli]MBT1687378.1 hypothetical protein [Dawidia soli]
MGYDLMVFNKESAPRSRAQFMQWYEEQTTWVENHGNVGLAHVSRSLRGWLSDMVKVFPAARGPFAHTMYNNLADYSIGKDIIYVSFSDAAAKAAYTTSLALAGKYEVGFFDVSTENAAILFPENGRLLALPARKKEPAPRKGWLGVNWLSPARIR